jgi:hypothetical protein
MGSCAFALGVPASAQDHAGHAQPPTQAAEDEHAGHAAGAPAAGHEHAMAGAHDGALGEYAMTRESSGTAWQPDASPMHGEHAQLGAWSVMTHGFVFLNYTDQGGKRGDEDFFSTNMFMAMGQRQWGPGTFGLRGMLSLEPATVGDDGYPLLFQTGETADGQTPLVDAQHPHDLFMELAASYSIPVGSDQALFAYVGWPGEPALGPPTFMHRFSGMENPEAPLSHHWLDSTHITYGVATLGWIAGMWKLDASAFNGAEPDEDRWDLEDPELDSYSARISMNPSPEWSFQVSYGALESPEQLEPDTDVDRTTGSAMWSRPFEDGIVQTTLAFGLNQKRPGDATTAVLLESACTFHEKTTWFGRAERVEKDELFPPGDPLEDETFPVVKLSLGVSREIAAIDRASVAIGAMGGVHFIEDKLETAYGETPTSFLVFLRARF